LGKNIEKFGKRPERNGGKRKMTKNEFKHLETICKDAWKELAKTGNGIKPRSLRMFINNCPACEISMRVKDTHCQNCDFCPIVLWRNKPNIGNVNCQDDDGLYWKWFNTTNVDERKEYAKQISKLQWKYLLRYKDVDISVCLKKWRNGKNETFKKV